MNMTEEPEEADYSGIFTGQNYGEMEERSEIDTQHESEATVDNDNSQYKCSYLS